MDHILTWKQLLKRLYGHYTHMEKVAQEAPWILYSHGYSCVRGSTDTVITHQDAVAQETP